MKFSSKFFLPLSFVVLVACSKSSDKTAPATDATATTQPTATASAQPATDIKTVMINVPTAKCEECEGAIKTAVQKVDGVKDVQVDSKKHTAQVQFIAARATQGQIEKAISDAGYTANDTKRDSKAYDKLESCCK